MASAPAPSAPLTRRHRALLAAVAANRCQLTPGRLPSLMIDRRCACDQLAAHQLLTSGLVRPGRPRADGVIPAELTPAGRAAARLSDEDC